MLALLVSVAAMLWLPLLSRVTLNTCTPASAAVNVYSAGNPASASLLVKYTVPV